MAPLLQTSPRRSRRFGDEPLRFGDHMTSAEFERRYEAMPGLKKAELIEGIVHMPSPVRIAKHAKPHSFLDTWLTTYSARTPGTEAAVEATVRLDNDNQFQPDVLLRILPERGGQSRDEAGYVAGAPEFVAEVTASTVSYDLFEKKDVFRRHGAREYLVWLVEETRIEWWRLDAGRYVAIQPEGGVWKSSVFPGLWLEADALLSGDFATVLATLEAGVATGGHAEFRRRLGA